MEIVEVKYLTYAELEEILNKVEEENKVIRSLKGYVKEFKKLEKEKALELIEKIKGLGISEAKLPEELIYQIVNILPRTKEELRTILKFSRLPFNEEEVNKIFSVLSEYVKG